MALQRRRLLAVCVGLCAVSCGMLLLGSGYLQGSGSSEFLSVLPKGLSLRKQPAARFIQQTLKGLSHDADEKLAGHNLHRHARKTTTKKAVKKFRRHHVASSPLDPDVVERRARKLERFDRGQSMSDLQRSLNSQLFSTTRLAHHIPSGEVAHIAKLESAKLPGPLASIPKDLLEAKKAQTTMLTDRLSYRGVNTGYAEDSVQNVPRIGGKLMHAFGVNTGEEGGWEGEDHWVDEQVPIGETFSKNFGVQPAPGHPEGFAVNKYWAPVFGAIGERGQPGRHIQLTAEDEGKTTMLTDRLSHRGVNTGYPEDSVQNVPRIGGKLMHAFGVNTGEEGAWDGEDHWVDEQVPIGETFSKNFGVQPAPGHPEGFAVNKYWAPVFGAIGERGRSGRPTMLAQLNAEVEDHNGIPELRLDEAPDPTARSSLRASSAASSSRPGSSSRLHAQEREEAREEEIRDRTRVAAPKESAQSRESKRDADEKEQARGQQVQYTPETASEQAAWLAAGSQGPVNAGGGVLNARSAAGAMEDGAVADDEESDAMSTLRAAMSDSRQKTPGHREPVARQQPMSNRQAQLAFDQTQQPYESYYAWKWRISHGN